MPDSHPHMQPLDLVEQLELSPGHRKCRQDKLSTMLSRRDRPGGGPGGGGASHAWSVAQQDPGGQAGPATQDPSPDPRGEGGRPLHPTADQAFKELAKPGKPTSS